MSLRRRKRTVAAGLVMCLALAIAAWIAGGQVRSPAQIAAETAAPAPSAITAPVERRVLSSEVIVRGTVRYGSPQPVVLAASSVKQSGAGSGSGSADSDIVTSAPRRGARLGEGSVAMSVSGRPVFVLRGAQPTHRDIGPGSRGPDVRQLESALARMGFSPGALDGRYGGDTAAAVARWYEQSGWSPFGTTDAQREQLRSAEAAASQARDAHLQARVAIQTAAEGGVTPGEIAQARIDFETARDAVDTAELGLRTARNRAATTRTLAQRTSAITLAIQNEQRDNVTAAAEVELRRAALNKALEAQAEAQRNLAAPATAPPASTPAAPPVASQGPPGSTAVPPDAGTGSAAGTATSAAPPDPAASSAGSPPDPVALGSAVRQAGYDVAAAQAELDKAIAAARATPAAGREAVDKARADRRQALSDARTAAAEVLRAGEALPTARRQVTLAARRLQVLESPGDTSLQRLLSLSAQKEANGTAREVTRLARKLGIRVPANEVLFFSTVPLRVDAVRVKRGDTASGGRVMTVSNSRLSIDSSLSLNDAKLVRSGASVQIDEPDLGIRTTGTVTRVADRPGTNKVDSGRVYLEVTPRTAPAQLVGASAKLTIAVKSTDKAVLVVPVTALSVGADGNSRVQVQGASGRSRYVTVEPGLAAKGLVEVRPGDGRLVRGDLVIVGARDAPKGVASASAAGAALGPLTGGTP